MDTERKITKIGVRLQPSLIQDSEEHCLIAVRSSSEALRWIENPSPQVLKAAVRKYSHALEMVKNQTEELCYISVTQCGYSIKFVQEQFKTDRVLEKAVKANPGCIKYISNPSEKICLMAVRRDADAISFIENPTQKVIMTALKKNGIILSYLKVPQTIEMCLTALESNDAAYYYVKICENPSYEETLDNLKKMQLKEKVLSL